MALQKKQKSELNDDTSAQPSTRNDDSTAQSQQDEAKALLEAAKLKEESGQCAFC